MTENHWSKWGEDIKKTVQNSIDSRDFTDLNESIGKIIDSAMKNIGEGFKSAKKKDIKYTGNGYKGAHGNATSKNMSGQACDKNRERVSRPVYERKSSSQFAEKKAMLPKLYGGSGEVTALGIVFLIFGIMGIVGFSIGLLTILLMPVLNQSVFTASEIVVSAVMGSFLVGSIVLTAKGKSMISLASRFRQYRAIIGTKMYGMVKELAERTGRRESFIKKDLKRMIKKKFFLQGCMDEQESCLIISAEAYRQYQQAQEQYLLRKQEEKKKEAEYASLPETVRQVVAEGEKFIQKIHASNDTIPGEEISRKIDYMENIVRKIFQRVQQKPDLVDDLRKLMSYYLPTTIKLLDVYEELDAQPVQGPNISSSKKEIEKTMDTLNTAFEKILDDFYQDTAWDVSSDISVLETMLAQEGLKKSDFEDV